MIKHSSRGFAAFAGALALVILSAQTAFAGAKVGSQIFQGEIVHVSASNLKVTDPKSKQTLGFLIIPHFKNVFAGHKQTTYQEAKLHNGQYVKVFYDQKALGARHADRIEILDNANMKMGQQKG